MGNTSTGRAWPRIVSRETYGDVTCGQQYIGNRVGY